MDVSNQQATLINPVQITKRDKDDRPLENILAARASTAGPLTASDGFPRSSYRAWSVMVRDTNGLVIERRTYFDIPGAGYGVENTNYRSTHTSHDTDRRPNRFESPGGTIQRVVFDALGRPVSLWAGSDDTGATDDDPDGPGSGANDMVVIAEMEYETGVMDEPADAPASSL